MILNFASDIQRGTVPTNSVYLGNTLVWPHSGGYIPVEGERHYGIRFRGGANGLYEYEYLYDAAGKQPAVMDAAGHVTLGGWADAFFVRNNYPCMLKYSGVEDYKLDPADVRFKLDGSASDYNNYAYDGNAMSCFNCPIWIKFYVSDGWCCIEVADRKLDRDFMNYPYIRPDGSSAEKMYYPLYSGTVVDSRLRSIGAGRVKESHSYLDTLSDFQLYASRNGTGWHIKTYAFMLWIEALLVLMFRGYQVTRETGCAAFNNYTNGMSYDKGQFNYERYDSDHNCVHNTFYCEWLWGGRREPSSREALVGLYCINKKNTAGDFTPFLYYKMRYPYTYAGSPSGYSTLLVYDTSVKWSCNKNYGILPNVSGNLSEDTVKAPYLPSSSYVYEEENYPRPYAHDTSENGLLCFDFNYYNIGVHHITTSVFYV